MLIWGSVGLRSLLVNPKKPQPPGSPQHPLITLSSIHLLFYPHHFPILTPEPFLSWFCCLLHQQNRAYLSFSLPESPLKTVHVFMGDHPRPPAKAGR